MADKEAALSKAELRKFRRLLLEKRRSILGDLDGMTEEARGSSVRGLREGPSTSASGADEDLGTETTIGLLAHERTLLREVHEALERIERGTYGTCVATGKPIGKARLTAQPWAKYCIEHARSLERRPRPGRLVVPSWQQRPSMLASLDEDEGELDELIELESLAVAEEAE
ncbi:MAG: TraR/DksA C4-type zinc finger protein [Phycisphaerae bacterium]